jgi:hypothetical protein
MLFTSLHIWTIFICMDDFRLFGWFSFVWMIFIIFNIINYFIQSPNKQKEITKLLISIKQVWPAHWLICWRAAVFWPCKGSIIISSLIVIWYNTRNFATNGAKLAAHVVRTSDVDITASTHNIGSVSLRSGFGAAHEDSEEGTLPRAQRSS